MKYKWKQITCILVAVLGLSACTKTSTPDVEAPTPTEKKEYQSNLDVIQPLAYGNVNGLNLEPGTNISLIGRSSNGEFWKVLQSGAQQAVDDINEQLGYAGEDKVTLTYSGPSTKDSVDEQVNILDEELALYPSAIAISIADSNACEVQFDLATENNIPIIAFESGSNYEGIQSMITTNNIEATQTAASKLCDAIDHSGEVLLFVHDSYSTAAIERTNTFKELIETNYPDISIGDIVYLDQLDSLRQTMTDSINSETLDVPPVLTEDITDDEVLEYIFEEHPDAKGCITTDADATKTIVDAVEKAGLDSFEIIGFEGGKNQLSLLKNESISGLIVQNPFGMGYAAVVASARSILELGNESVVDCGYIWVTNENIDTESIQKLLY